MKETSIKAHESIKPHKMTMCDKILQHLRYFRSGKTSHEIANGLNMKINSVTARLNELEASGAVVVEGNRKTQGNGFSGIYKATGKPHKKVKVVTRTQKAKIDTIVDVISDIEDLFKNSKNPDVGMIKVLLKLKLDDARN